MAIQPIDLQTMYSQLSNLSKSMAGAQQAQLTEAMQQQANIQKGMEKSKAVKQTSNEKSTAGQINHDGSNNTAYQQQKHSYKNDNEEEEPENKAGTGDLPYLGTLIDITR